MDIALPSLDGLETNQTTPRNVYRSLKYAVLDPLHRSALSAHLAANLLKMSDSGAHNLFKVLDYILTQRTMSLDAFLASRTQLYGSSNRTKCEEVWNGDHIAYRCRTCGLSDSSCMCVGCFDPAQHENHDYRIYRCSYGGCCDCGDDLAWKPSGFCSKHSTAASGASSLLPLPSDEAASVEVVVDTLLQCITGIIRRVYDEFTKPATIDFTHVIDKQRWKSSIPRSLSALSMASQTLVARLSLCLLQLQSLATSCLQYRAAICRQFLNPVSGVAVVAPRGADVLEFWLTFGVLLPTDSVDAIGVFFLKLLMDKDFKALFTVRFLDAYAFYIQLFKQADNSDGSHTRKHISRYIDRLFCQLFHSTAQLREMDTSAVLKTHAPLHGLPLTSNARLTLSEALTCYLVKQLGFVLATSASRSPTLRTNHPWIKTRVYARFCSELRCLLVHSDFSIQVIDTSWASAELDQESIYAELLRVLCSMQLMDMQVKQVGRHVEFGSDAWQAAFVLDYEIMLVWQHILNGFKQALTTAHDSKSLAQRWLDPISKQLEAWWQHVRLDPSPDTNVQRQVTYFARKDLVDRSASSMHLPLHHFWASMLDEAHRTESNEWLWTLVQSYDRSFWLRCTVHPILVQDFVRSIKCQEWIRNGQSMWHQVIHYHSRHWRYHGLHNDLFLMQLAAAALPPSVWMSVFLSQWLHHSQWENLNMIDEGLKAILQVVLDPTKIAALPPWELLMRNAIHCLSIGPLTRSEVAAKCDLRLVELVKSATGDDEEEIFSRLLNQVGVVASGVAADTSPFMVLRGADGNSGSAGTTTYILKPEAWSQVCPLFECFTAIDVQKCEQNALDHDKTIQLLPVLQYVRPAVQVSGSIHGLMVTHILACRNVLALVFWILHEHNEADGLVHTALYYLYISTSLLPSTQVMPPPFITPHDRLNAIAAAFGGTTWWDHLTVDVKIMTPPTSILALVRALVPRYPLAAKICDAIQATTATVDTKLPQPMPTNSCSKPPAPATLSAKERQAKILARLKAQQEAFLIAQLHKVPNALPLLDTTPSTIKDKEDVDDIEPLGSPPRLQDEEETMCSLCHEAKTNALHFMGFLTPTKIATKTQPAFSTKVECHIRICGHSVHQSCMEAYLVALRATHNEERLLSREHDEFLCPVCRRLCNTLVPLTLSTPNHGFADDSLDPNVVALATKVHQIVGDPSPPSRHTLVNLFAHCLYVATLSLQAIDIGEEHEIAERLDPTARRTLELLFTLLQPCTALQSSNLATKLIYAVLNPADENRGAETSRLLTKDSSTDEDGAQYALAQRQLHVLRFVVQSKEAITARLRDAFNVIEASNKFSLDSPVFQLIQLPKLYVDIYLKYCQRTATCEVCHQAPTHPALCLLCGTLVCCYAPCCSGGDGVGECTNHVRKCGVGFGVFLLLRACTVLLLLGHGRCCIWGSLYLDRNGEDDAYFRRGKPLYLNHERLATLTRLVVLHGFTESTALLNNTTRRDGTRY
ncbi:hypothetical protein Ae201684_006689 [Aphanomyces euteiches]|uniref:E3 ubiquitin-protein ligase n=1 Tax=Aphanomyces euteiches TaxID=100861 RepID=A0A6G0XBY9_9STRA|nr:hypothetical protein Ae201684_006689 [Aphanomyces euteiches]